MSYENYYFVSWSNGTPITGERLAQMSINIDQVKEASDGAAKGIVAYRFDAAFTGTWTDFWTTGTTGDHEIIYLRDENTANAAVYEDNRVNIGPNRYYKLSFTIPHIRVNGPGAEDSRFSLILYQGTSLANSPTAIYTWDITPPTFSYLNVAAATANIANEAVKSNTYNTRIAGGTYTYPSSTIAGITNGSYFVAIRRTAGANTNNAPSYSVIGQASQPLMFFAEDAGSI